jgi:Flp pilus assembly CpaE family ATPase
VTLDVLDDATTIVLVVSQELTAVKSATRLLGSLRTRYGPDRVQVALAREDKHAEIAPEDLERTLCVAVRVFPNEYRRSLEALNHGKPLVLDKQGRLAGEVTRFVRHVSGVAVARPAAERRSSLLPAWLKGGVA